MKNSFPSLSHYYLVVMLIFNVGTVKSVPADPNPIKLCQPNGDTISIRLKGDEHYHQVETEDGYTLVESSNKTLEYATQDAEGNLVSSHITAKNKANRNDNERKTLSRISQHLQASPQQKSSRLKSSPAPQEAKVKSSSNAVTGKKKVLCILIGFTDMPFKKTKAEFENLFNKPGYNVNGGTGSVRDFYLEASYNQLELNTTVVGPYTASKDWAYYGSNVPSQDANCNELIVEACQLADPTVNFADYDNDGDGVVDQVIVIHAGYEEGAGGGANSIWSHEGGLYPSIILDGKSISKHCIVSELSSNQGSNIVNIGPICHEFGHCLGAADFYDTNHDVDGSYNGTGYWDLMAAGMWNNNGCTPAHPNAYIKSAVYGWTNAKTLKTGQSVQILNSTKNTNQFYRINSLTPGEYYLLENKQQVGFDSYVSDHGMLIYHVDSAYNAIHGLGGDNCINCTSHQGTYIVASGSSTPNGVSNSWNCTYPSASNFTSFTDNTTPNMKSWAGDNTYAPLTNITENTVTKIIGLDFKGGVPGVAPSTQASNLTLSNLKYGSLTLNWKRGNGDGVIILARESTPISTTPFDGVHYLSNAKFGTASCQLGGAYVVYNGAGNSVDVSELKFGTTYYFSAYEYKGVSVAYKSPSLDANASTLGGSVCNIATNHNTKTYCSKVQFNTISQVSQIVPGVYNNYLDYTNSRTNVTPGSTYPLSVTLTTLSGMVYSKAWIDWNRNGSFDDAGESYDLGSVYSPDYYTPPLTVNVAVPSNEALGIIPMRVSCKKTSNFGSCDGGAITGEMQVQDYLLNVLSGIPTTVREGEESILKVYPNPVSEVLRIEGISSFSNINFQIFDIHGQLVKTGSINPSNSISVSDLPQGMYFLKLENGMLAKFIKH